MGFRQRPFFRIIRQKRMVENDPMFMTECVREQWFIASINSDCFARQGTDQDLEDTILVRSHGGASQDVRVRTP
jgi:hypothetical protein